MNNNNTCSYCRARPATGRCGKCATRYCGRNCQREDWLNGVHKTSCIGNKEDVYEEPHTRDLAIPPFVVLGPSRYSWYRWNGINFWFFGEYHEQRIAKWMQEGLDVKVSAEGDVEFVGTDSGLWFIARLFYALGAAARRNLRQLDMFIENKLGPYNPNPRMTNEILRILFYNTRCLSMDRSVNVHCDFAPFARVHFADYRDHNVNLFKWVYKLAYAYFRKGYKNNMTVIPEVDALQSFIRRLSPGWTKRVFQTILLSDNFSFDMISWLKEPLRDLPEMGDTILAAYDTGIKTTRVRKQYLRLLEENETLASIIMKWLLDSFKASMDWTERLQKVYETKTLGEYELPVIKAGSWIMDAAVLFRMFRTFGTSSQDRFFYLGTAHIQRYEWFFENVLGAVRVDTGGSHEYPTEEEFFVTLNDPARDELQKLLM
jgi:hypothetical protein